MIGRALSQDTRLVVLDEPTAALTAPEIDHLFQVIRETAKFEERLTSTSVIDWPSYRESGSASLFSVMGSGS